jgi:hypothetical protein
MALTSWQSEGGVYFNLSSCFVVILLGQNHARFRELKAPYGHVACAVQEVSNTASKGAQNSSYCPRNECCAVELRTKPLMFKARGPSRMGIVAVSIKSAVW